MTTTVTAPQTVATSRTFGLTLKHLEGYAFRIEFDDEDGLDSIITDEPGPLGENRGPSPARLLAVAVANCLASSLLHCLQKSRATVEGLEVRVEATISRNEARRLRVERLHVFLDPRVSLDDRYKLTRCTDLFQDFCMVTESVRSGIDVRVTVATQ